MKKIFNIGGYTYIELILYIAIVTIMMQALIPFAWSIIQGGVKSSVQQEVFSQTRFISEKLKLEIRNAGDISLAQSDFDVNLAENATKKITLTTLTGQTIVIDVSSGVVRIKRGSNPPVAINAANIAVTDLTFTNYSSLDSKTKHVGFMLSTTSSNPSPRQEYQANIALKTSSEIRSN
ncbi:MAG: hypothetical protein HY429_02030 [Candidatus Levybacteria bacterium]|nr:hypothetical protein [Candidatus Levybacteria bacterium]